jgi:hypothetical protein
MKSPFHSQIPFSSQSFDCHIQRLSILLTTNSRLQTVLLKTSRHEPHRKHRLLTISLLLQNFVYLAVAKTVFFYCFISMGTCLLPLPSNELFRISEVMSQYIIAVSLMALSDIAFVIQSILKVRLLQN